MTLTRCNCCVYPTTKPDLHFKDGICSACDAFHYRPEVDWAARYRELQDILARAVPNKDGFDCIVPSSGGKDSTAQVMTLKALGANPLVVTASTCFLTPLGRANIDNLARHAKTIEYHPDYVVRRKLNRLGLELVGDISHPEHMAIFSVPFRAAIEHDIPLIFYGENPQREYGGPLGSQDALQMTKRWVSEFGGLLGMRPADFVGLEGITSGDMDYYRMPRDEDMDRVDAYFLGQFLPWSSTHNAEAAIRAGMQYKLPSPANFWPWENLDNAMTGLHDHAMFRKFGYGRMAAQVSVEVRNRRMTRQQALRLIEDRDGLFPEAYAGVPLAAVLDYLNVSRDWLLAQLDAHTNWDLFQGQLGSRPILREFALLPESEPAE